MQPGRNGGRFPQQDFGGAWVEEGGKDRHRREIEAEVGEKGCSEVSVESSLAGAGVPANSSSDPPVLAR